MNILVSLLSNIIFYATAANTLEIYTAMYRDYLPERVDAVSRYAVTAGHEYADGRVLVCPYLSGCGQLIALCCVTVCPVVRHHSLTIARVNSVAQAQEYVHPRRRDFVAVPITSKRPFDRFATIMDVLKIVVNAY